MVLEHKHKWYLHILKVDLLATKLFYILERKYNSHIEDMVCRRVALLFNCVGTGDLNASSRQDTNLSASAGTEINRKPENTRLNCWDSI